MLRGGSKKGRAPVAFAPAALAVLAGAVATAFGAAACVGDDPTLTSTSSLCSTYCSEMAKHCSGPNRQYRSDEECMSACKDLPPGNPDDGQRDSVNCRLTQARAASTLASCNAAGPFGGGVCGSRCEAFCAILSKNCVAGRADAPPFASEGDCLEECAAFRFDPTGGEGPDQPFNGENTINCRENHLILSLAAPNPHCSHAGVVSTPCQGAASGDGGMPGM